MSPTILRIRASPASLRSVAIRGSQSEPYEAEQNGLKNRFVLLVKRAIQEYVPTKFGPRQLDVYPFGGNESLP